MKKLLLVILLILVAYLAWRAWRRVPGGAAADRGQSLFYDRLWVDHLPTSPTDRIQLFAAVTEQPVGIFDQRSHWKGDWELFHHEARGDGQVELLFPQSKSKSRVSYRAWKCNEKKEFDFCLELTGGKGAKKYYSQRGWEIGSLPAARAAEARLLSAAPGGR
jgi:hypothetical protein